MIEAYAKGFLSLFNLFGKELLKKNIMDIKTVIDISALPAGIDFLMAKDGRCVEVIRLVKYLPAFSHIFTIHFMPPPCMY